MREEHSVKRIVKLTFREEECNRFMEIYKESEKKISQFTGCKSVELLRSKNLDNIFFTFSVWTGEEALENYRKSDLFKSTWSRVKPLFGGKPEAWTLEVI